MAGKNREDTGASTASLGVSGFSLSEPSISRIVDVPSFHMGWVGPVVTMQCPVSFSLVGGLPQTYEDEANKSLEQAFSLFTAPLHSIACLAC